MTFELDHVIRLRKLVDEYGLPAWPGFYDLTVPQLQRMYNGIGPDKYGKAVSELTTDILSIYEPAALIHDAGFTAQALGGDNDGSHAGFACINRDFADGCQILANKSKIWFELFRPQQRALRRFVGRQLAHAVSSDAGWDVWVADSKCTK